MIAIIVVCAVWYIGIGILVFQHFTYKEYDLDHILSYSIFWPIYLIIIITKSIILAANCFISDILDIF